MILDNGFHFDKLQLIYVFDKLKQIQKKHIELIKYLNKVKTLF